MNVCDMKIEKVSSIYRIQRLKYENKNISERTHYGMVIIKNGKISYCYNGVEYIQTAGVVMLIPKGISYSFYCHEDADSYVINFEEESDLLKDKMYSVKVSNVYSVFDKINKKYHTSQIDSYERYFSLMSLVYDIMSNIAKNLSRDNQQIKCYETIEPSIKFMEEHYSDCDIKNDDLAKLSNVSTVHFRKVFKKIYGVSPIRYLELLKIEKAKELLVSKELSVNEIALVTGFADSSHFCHSFKKITGFSPGDYRKTFIN